MKTDGNGFSRLSIVRSLRGTKALQVGVYAQHRSGPAYGAVDIRGGNTPLNETTRKNFRGTRRTGRTFRALTDFPPCSPWPSKESSLVFSVFPLLRCCSETFLQPAWLKPR